MSVPLLDNKFKLLPIPVVVCPASVSVRTSEAGTPLAETWKRLSECRARVFYSPLVGILTVFTELPLSCIAPTVRLLFAQPPSLAPSLPSNPQSIHHPSPDNKRPAPCVTQKNCFEGWSRPPYIVSVSREPHSSEEATLPTTYKDKCWETPYPNPLDGPYL